jgi:hypothetical protein
LAIYRSCAFSLRCTCYRSWRSRADLSAIVHHASSSNMAVAARCKCGASHSSNDLP